MQFIWHFRGNQHQRRKRWRWYSRQYTLKPFRSTADAFQHCISHAIKEKLIYCRLFDCFHVCAYLRFIYLGPKNIVAESLFNSLATKCFLIYSAISNRLRRHATTMPAPIRMCNIKLKHTNLECPKLFLIFLLPCSFVSFPSFLCYASVGSLWLACYSDNCDDCLTQ